VRDHPGINKPTTPQFSPEVAEIRQLLQAALPDMAAHWISETLDMSVPENRPFAKEPDSPLEHTPQWHQYGIITHSFEFGNDLLVTVPEYLERWGLTEPVQTTLSAEIDTVTKEKLLQITAFVHDVGKFFTRKIVRSESGTNFSFPHHEKHSGTVLRGEMRPLLEK
jgi:hypothetical protein